MSCNNPYLTPAEHRAEVADETVDDLMRKLDRRLDDCDCELDAVVLQGDDLAACVTFTFHGVSACSLERPVVVDLLNRVNAVAGELEDILAAGDRQRRGVAR